MIERWIESVFIKRVILSLVSGMTSYLTVHAFPGMVSWGITVNIDPQKLSNMATVAAMALAQGLHEWIAVKYPLLGKYL